MSDTVLVGLLGAVFVLPLLIAGINQVVDDRTGGATGVKIGFPILWLISLFVHYAVAYEGYLHFGDLAPYWVFGAILNIVSAVWLLAVVFEWD